MAAELIALLGEARRECLRERDELKAWVATQLLAISGERRAGLQARLEAMRAAKLLTDQELWALEDICGDYLELGPVTVEMAASNDAASKCVRLVRISEGMSADRAFARQACRKFVA